MGRGIRLACLCDLLLGPVPPAPRHPYLGRARPRRRRSGARRVRRPRQPAARRDRPRRQHDAADRPALALSRTLRARPPPGGDRARPGRRRELPAVHARSDGSPGVAGRPRRPHLARARRGAHEHAARRDRDVGRLRHEPPQQRRHGRRRARPDDRRGAGRVRRRRLRRVDRGLARREVGRRDDDQPPAELDEHRAGRGHRVAQRDRPRRAGRSPRGGLDRGRRGPGADLRPRAGVPRRTPPRRRRHLDVPGRGRRPRRLGSTVAGRQSDGGRSPRRRARPPRRAPG